VLPQSSHDLESLATLNPDVFRIAMLCAGHVWLVNKLLTIAACVVFAFGGLSSQRTA
jgi:hypothetical protein